MGLLSALLDVAFPRACAGCGGPVGDEWSHICWDCLASMRMVDRPFCAQCGDPVDGETGGDYTCSWCRHDAPHFDLARSAARYDGRLKTIVQAFKYSRATWLRDDLASLLHACVQTHYAATPIDAVTFVPLYPAKERHRTYNQAALLAGRLAKRLGKPLLRRCLVRVAPASSQTRLTARQRRENIRNAFEPRQQDWLAGRCLLLVDDVMTTGATVDECARALKKGGAARVYVATVARG